MSSAEKKQAVASIVGGLLASGRGLNEMENLVDLGYRFVREIERQGKDGDAEGHPILKEGILS